jgi:hypothetical protein
VDVLLTEKKDVDASTPGISLLAGLFSTVALMTQTTGGSYSRSALATARAVPTGNVAVRPGKTTESRQCGAGQVNPSKNISNVHPPAVPAQPNHPRHAR